VYENRNLKIEIEKIMPQVKSAANF